MEKGELHGECNRTACSNKNAKFFNHSTEKHYCGTCAKLINDANLGDSLRLYGHELCTIATESSQMESIEVHSEEILSTGKTLVVKEFNEKGFQIIKLNVHQMLKLGGLCICDSCSEGMFTSTYIGALNRAYCDSCYEDWIKRAKFYPEDVSFETRATDRTLAQLNS